jgi:hypothetical protein
VPLTPEEWETIAAFCWVEGVEPVAAGIDCPFLGWSVRSSGEVCSCAIYEVRPRVCRLMGHVPRLNCPRANVRFISPSEERRFLDGYHPTLLLPEECRCPDMRPAVKLWMERK